ncbi:uncharacterized protein METZ01_LOCUS82424, partial [marine metagenome]
VGVQEDRYPPLDRLSSPLATVTVADYAC